MPKEQKPQSLREQALSYLARREHSRLELTCKLEHAGHPPEEIGPLLSELEDRNWLSDRRFAESFVADHRAKSGAAKLAYELKQRGVADSIIQDVLNHQNDSELERAREVWRKKFGAPPANVQEKAKQIRFLQGRGFSLDIIRPLFKDL